MTVNTYWLSFRLEDNRSYRARYDALMDAVQQLSQKWWVEPSSFLVFSSSESIDSVAAAVKAAVDPNVDLVTIGMPDYKSARLIGNNGDPDVFDLIPFMRRA